MNAEDLFLSGADHGRMLDELLDEVLGLGPLERLMRNPTISDILINGPFEIYVERRGRLEVSEVQFRDSDQLLQVLDRIVSRVGRHIDESSPMVDARLPDGSRVNAIISPLSLKGPLISIRRFGRHALQMDDLLRFKMFTAEMALLMQGAIQARLNVVISGGTGAGQDDPTE